MTDAPPPGTAPAPSPVTLPAASPVPGGPDGPGFGEPVAGGHGAASRALGRARRGRRAQRGRPRRTRTRWRAAFFALAGVTIVVAVGWALLGNRVFVVRSVTVTGTHLVAPVRVLAAADVRLGTPLLSLNTGVVIRRVDAIRVDGMSDVASATVTEDWPDHVVIAVTERVPVMAVRMAGGGYDQIDPTGVIVQWTQAKPATLPVLVTPLPGGALRGAPTVAAAAGVLGELQPWLERQVAQVSTAAIPAGPVEVTLGLRDGKTVQWGSVGNAAQKNRELSILLTGQVHSVDVSSPGTVVTK
jgi:cell division protein FtsQ